MSLLNQASNWDNFSNNKKKRKSTLIEPYTNVSDSINEVKKETEQRNAAIHKLINEMDTVDNEEETELMENFQPIPNPLINHRKDLETKKIFDPSYNQNKNAFIPSQKSNDMMSNYETIYKPPDLIHNFEGFNNMNNNIKNYGNDDLLLKKINYMINLLEEQKHEKTNNITEEFILYTFLGIFTIYIVDSFSRSGKYRR